MEGHHHSARGPYQRVSPDVRHMIVEAVLEQKMDRMTVAAKFNIKKRTVDYLVNFYVRNGRYGDENLHVRRIGSGKPRCIAKEEVDVILSWYREDARITLNDLRHRYAETFTKPPPCVQTFANLLRERGLSKSPKSSKRKRADDPAVPAPTWLASEEDLSVFIEERRHDFDFAAATTLVASCHMRGVLLARAYVGPPNADDFDNFVAACHGTASRFLIKADEPGRNLALIAAFSAAGVAIDAETVPQEAAPYERQLAQVYEGLRSAFGVWGGTAEERLRAALLATLPQGVLAGEGM
jgi:transposase